MADEWTTPENEKVSLDSERPRLLNAVRYVESRGNPNAVSPAGAQGPYQFMPATAKRFGITDPRDEAQSRAGADKYLTQLTNRYGGNEDLALMAYNWGEGNVDAYLKTGKGVNGQPMPRETQEYPGKVRAAQREQSASTDGEWSTPANESVKNESVLKVSRHKPLEKPKSEAQARAEKVLAEEPFYKRALIGAGKKFTDVGRAWGIADPGDPDIEKAIEADTAAKLGGFGAEAALTAVPGMKGYSLALRGLGKVAPRIVAKEAGLGSRLIQGAVGGAGAGAVSEGIMSADPVSGAAYGAVLGPAGEFLVSGAGGAYKTAKELTANAEDVFGTMFRKGLGPERTQNVIDALRLGQKTPTLPGETLTVGRMATEATPELKVLEETARRSPGANRLLEIDQRNEAARFRPLEEIAAPAREGVATQGGRIPPSRAQAVRETETRPLYRQAAGERVEIPPLLEGMLRGPEVESAFQAGRDKFLQHQMAEFNNGRVPPKRAVPADLKNGQFAEYSVRELQFIKDELTGKINRLAASGKRDEAYQLDQVRRALTQEMESQSGTYRKATSEYRRLSEPQNQGQVAQELINALRSPAGNERTAAFVKAMRDAPETIRNALGDTRFRQLEQVMTNPQMNDISAVLRSLEREQAYANLQAPKGVMKPIESLPEQLSAALPPVFSAPMTVVRRMLRNIGVKSDKDVAQVMNEVVTDPERLATILERVPLHERNRFVNAVRSIARDPRAAGLTIGTITGQIQENQ